MFLNSTETVMALHKARVDDDRRAGAGRLARNRARVRSHQAMPARTVLTEPLRPVAVR